MWRIAFGLPGRKHWPLSSSRQKPVEPPSPMLSLSDFETKFDRKKSQTNQVAMRFRIPPRFSTRLLFFNDSALSFFRSCQRRTHITTSYSRRSAKMSCSNRVSSLSSCLDDMFGLFHFGNWIRVCHQVTPAPCRETCCIKAKCSSRKTGSASTPKSLAKISRYAKEKLQTGNLWQISNTDRLSLIVLPRCQISIPVMSVKLIKKTKTALLVPNALVIGTTDIDVRKLYNWCSS